MHRSGMTVLFVMLAAVGLLAARAHAQQAPAVVAGPLPQGASLVAFDRGGRLCLQVRAPRRREPVECLDGAPDTARHTGFASVGQPPGEVWYAALTPDVAAVEMRFADGERVSARTSAGAAYRGRFAGRVRFVLLASRTQDPPYLTRLVGADGRVLAGIGNPFA